MEDKPNTMHGPTERPAPQPNGKQGSDELLVSQVLQGDRGAFAAIMRRYNQRLYRIARSYILDDDEVEDVIQEAYIKAYNNLRLFANRSKLSTWLIRIVINEALMRVRHRKRVASVGIDEGGTENSGHHMETAERETPIGKLMNSELRQILERAVDDLPEKYSTVFLMREVEGMSVADTSECLRITETNVKVRLSRAKEMLREKISGFYQQAEVFSFDLVRCDRIVQSVLSRVGETG
jgi:RNA polymerase sigma-70 factor (ECF subfamily)